MLSFKTVKTDVLVIGAGIAGLRAAVAAAGRGKKVIVASKGPRCSYGIMGFNAAVDREDSQALYYDDILKSGLGLSDHQLATLLAQGATKQKDFLEHSGLCFDKTADGRYDLLQPLGCSRPRLVHAGRFTGSESEKLFLEMLQKAGADVSFDTTVIDLLSDGDTVYGALAIRGSEGLCFTAKATVLATGGCGDIYPVTTYPAGIEGDGYAILARAGGELIDMEMLQFEPCCFAEPESLKGRGISTTMLNAGAKLRNAEGEEFLPKYFADPRTIQKGSLSRAMFSEIARCGGRPVLYDLSAIAPEELEMHCLWTKEIKQAGIDLSTTPLKVCPAAHTFLGGARVDAQCATSLQGLFAAGEALGGLHGANRIGGCAGAETFVMGAIAGDAAAEYCECAAALDSAKAEQLKAALEKEYHAQGQGELSSLAELRAQVRAAANAGLSIIRDEAGIAAAAHSVRAVAAKVRETGWRTGEELIQILSVRNMALVADLIALASYTRRESRGVFFRSDYPESRKDMEKNLVIRWHPEGTKISWGVKE